MKKNHLVTWLLESFEKHVLDIMRIHEITHGKAYVPGDQKHSQYFWLKCLCMLMAFPEEISGPSAKIAKNCGVCSIPEHFQ